MVGVNDPCFLMDVSSYAQTIFNLMQCNIYCYFYFTNNFKAIIMMYS